MLENNKYNVRLTNKFQYYIVNIEILKIKRKWNKFIILGKVENKIYNFEILKKVCRKRRKLKKETSFWITKPNDNDNIDFEIFGLGESQDTILIRDKALRKMSHDFPKITKLEKEPYANEEINLCEELGLERVTVSIEETSTNPIKQLLEKLFNQ